jgi:predicted ester cyclase
VRSIITGTVSTSRFRLAGDLTKPCSDVREAKQQGSAVRRERQVIEMRFGLTGQRPQTLEELARDPDVSTVVRALMAETEAVAAKLNIELPISIDQRMAGAEKVGAHKTSMLQDFEAGRPMELEAVVGAVVELGDRLGVPMPTTRAIYACAKMLDEKRGTANAAPSLVGAKAST